MLPIDHSYANAEANLGNGSCKNLPKCPIPMILHKCNIQYSTKESTLFGFHCLCKISLQTQIRAIEKMIADYNSSIAFIQQHYSCIIDEIGHSSVNGAAASAVDEKAI
ncbi:hypothetical protein CDAR_413851 [Caerostris darwini]|uniref:Uncharacterized protein n=1 Tax=Caerostris darwini TaxID=1538125 RepID=A0AAV4UEC2_9ARAC|nr:hypothetical protein CDAR_413851 [Caerostris darwini]